MQFTDEQEDIFQSIREKKSVVVEAAAGSGKTFTGKHAVSLVSGTVIQLAFNAHMADELAAAAPEGHLVKTIHGLAYLALRNAYPSTIIAHQKGWKIAQRVANNWMAKHPMPKPKLVRKRSLSANYEYNRLAQDIQKLSEIIREVQPSTRQAVIGLVTMYFSCNFINSTDYADMGIEAVQESVRVFQKTGEIDYTDMVYLPRKLQLDIPTADAILVDEVQDLSQAQFWICLQAARTGAQLIALGSDWQTLYRFRGVQRGRVVDLAAQLGCHILPLSQSFRCAPAVTKYVQDTLNAPITSAFTQPEGEVMFHPSAFMASPFGARAGDLILGYTNAELLALAAHYYLAGQPVFYRGAPALKKALAERVQGRNLPHAADMLGDALDMPLRDREAKLSGIIDTMCEHAPDKIQLSTIHGAKGREADRVWLMTPTIKGAENLDQIPLHYVGATRAKHSLFLTDVRTFSYRGSTPSVDQTSIASTLLGE